MISQRVPHSSCYNALPRGLQAVRGLLFRICAVGARVSTNRMKMRKALDFERQHKHGAYSIN
jgi:hypothetical protein